jgi:hypothetical protein
VRAQRKKPALYEFAISLSLGKHAAGGAKFASAVESLLKSDICFFHRLVAYPGEGLCNKRDCKNIASLKWVLATKLGNKVKIMFKKYF